VYLNGLLDRKVRETEPAGVAYVVCQGIGLDVGAASSDYVQWYDSDSKTLMDSLTRIQRTASQILEGKVAAELGIAGGTTVMVRGLQSME